MHIGSIYWAQIFMRMINAVPQIECSEIKLTAVMEQRIKLDLEVDVSYFNEIYHTTIKLLCS